MKQPKRGKVRRWIVKTLHSTQSLNYVFGAVIFVGLFVGATIQFKELSNILIGMGVIWFLFRGLLHLIKYLIERYGVCKERKYKKL